MQDVSSECAHDAHLIVKQQAVCPISAHMAEHLGYLAVYCSLFSARRAHWGVLTPAISCKIIQSQCVRIEHLHANSIIVINTHA